MTCLTITKWAFLLKNQADCDSVTSQMLLLFDCIRLNDVLRLAWPSEKSFTVLNIYSMNKDYAELENSKQKNSKQK